MTSSEMGKKGSKQRMKLMTPEQRKAVAQNAAKTRWAGHQKKKK